MVPAFFASASVPARTVVMPLYELAALTGDREGAIRAYNHYLELRSDPELEVVPEVEAVRAELALLVGEQVTGR